MADLRIPSRTYNSNFDLEDFKHDFTELDTVKQSKTFITVKDFYTDGMDWADAIQNAINSSAIGDVILFPNGTIEVGKQITLLPNRTYMGFGWTSTLKIKNNSNLTQLFYSPILADVNGVRQYQTLSLKDFQIDGNRDNQTSGHAIQLNNVQYAVIDNVKVVNCKQTGFYLRYCNTVHLKDCWARYCSGYGVYFDSTSSDMHINGGDFGLSSYENLYISSPSSSVKNATVWCSARAGIFVDKTAPNVEIWNCQVEGNKWEGVHVSGDHCHISNCKIYDNSNHESVYGLYDNILVDRDDAVAVKDTVITSNQIFAGLYNSVGNTTGYPRYQINLVHHVGAVISGNSLRFNDNNSTNTTTVRAFVNGLTTGDYYDNSERTTNSYVRLSLSANQAIGGSAWVKIPFNTVKKDINAEADIANNQIIIKEAGVYAINFSLFWNTATGIVLHRLNVGSSSFRVGGAKFNANASFCPSAGSITIDANANDVVYLETYLTPGDTLLGSSGGDFSWITLTRVK